MDPREPEGQAGDTDGGRTAGALGAGRFAHLASPEAGWAVPGVTGLGAVGTGDGCDDFEFRAGSRGAGVDGGADRGDGADAGAGAEGRKVRRRLVGGRGTRDAAADGTDTDDSDADGDGTDADPDAASDGTHADVDVDAVADADGGDADGGDVNGAGGGRFGASQAQEDPDRFLGFDALALLEEFEGLNGRLSAVVGTADAHGCRRLAERLTPLLRALEATCARAVGQAAAGGGFVSAGHGSARTWLAGATNVTRATAGGVLADAEFLDRQPDISAARDAGGMSWQHVAVFRRVLTAQPWREARFPTVADFFVTVACGVDPSELRRYLQGWADSVDDEEAPDRPDAPFTDRALHLRQVGELWDVRGTLPMLEGATLAGVLDEVIATTRRKACVCGTDPCVCPKDPTPRATKRADALTALAGWATAHRTCLHNDPLLSAGGAQRSRPTILVPLDRLAPHQAPATLSDYLHTHPPETRTPHAGCTQCNGGGSPSDGKSGSSRGSSQGSGRGSGSGCGQDSAGDQHGGSGCGGGGRGGGGDHSQHRTSVGAGQRPTSLDPGAGCTICGHPTGAGQNSVPTHTTPAGDGVAAGGAMVGDNATDGPAAAATPVGTQTVNGVRFTARGLNEGLAGLGVSQVRWYAGSESGTLNRRDTEVELCDATVARIITDPQGFPLDVGHDTRVINPGLRAALIVRDGGCVIPGCVTPATWCDAHHVIPWGAGGETSMQNLALTCREHHRAIHAGHWSITITDGLPEATPRTINPMHRYRRRRRR